MSLRTVFGTLPDFPNSNIVFTLTPFSASSANAIYQGLDIVARTNSLGYFSVSLWVNELSEITAQYKCTTPDNKQSYFFLPSSQDPIDISRLNRISQSQDSASFDKQTMIDFLNSKIDTALNNALNIATPFYYGDASPKIILSSFSGIICQASIKITAPFNGTTPTKLILGDGDQSDSIIPSGYVMAEQHADFEVSCKLFYTDATILLTINLGESVTQGSGYVLLNPFLLN